MSTIEVTQRNTRYVMQLRNAEQILIKTWNEYSTTRTKDYDGQIKRIQTCVDALRLLQQSLLYFKNIDTE